MRLRLLALRAPISQAMGECGSVAAPAALVRCAEPAEVAAGRFACACYTARPAVLHKMTCGPFRARLASVLLDRAAGQFCPGMLLPVQPHKSWRAWAARSQKSSSL